MRLLSLSGLCEGCRFAGRPNSKKCRECATAARDVGDLPSLLQGFGVKTTEVAETAKPVTSVQGLTAQLTDTSKAK